MERLKERKAEEHASRVVSRLEPCCNEVDIHIGMLGTVQMINN